MVLTGLRQQMDGREVPLTKGRIQFQSEGAEVFYRSIAIRPIREIPRVDVSRPSLDAQRTINGRSGRTWMLRKATGPWSPWQHQRILRRLPARRVARASARRHRRRSAPSWPLRSTRRKRAGSVFLPAASNRGARNHA